MLFASKQRRGNKEVECSFIKCFLQSVERFRMRQIRMERRDGNVAVIYRA